MAENENATKVEGAKPASDKKKFMIIIGLLMALEGVGVFFAVKMFSGGPAEATATEEGHGEGHDDGHGGEHGGKVAVDDIAKKGKLEEVKLGDCRPSNKITGKLITFQLSVSVLVTQEDLEKMKEMITMNESRLRDRINFVVRSAEPEHINEPGLDTLKRRMKYEFDRVLEDSNIIKEVLVPEFLQSGPGL